MTNILK